MRFFCSMHGFATKSCLVMKPMIFLTACVMAAVSRGFSASNPTEQPGAQSGLSQSEFIYQTAPFPECHASTIAESKGNLVAAWFGGTREGHSDVGIWLSRHLDSRWNPPVEVGNGIESPAKRY